MDILFAAKYVPIGKRPIGGVQTWVDTIARELQFAGHEVHFWEPGMSFKLMTYDLGVFANMGLTGHLQNHCRRSVCISHGIIEPERPGAADHLFYVSEGVRDHWSFNGGILRQPIDLRFWHPVKAGAREGIVRFSYRNSPTLAERLAKVFDMPYIHVADADPHTARKALSKAALVLASGRAALEAMACGAPTLIYDHRQAYQGPLMGTDLRRQMKNSYSGRGGIDPTLAQLTGAAEFTMHYGSQREWVEKHHDARAVAAQLLKVST